MVPDAVAFVHLSLKSWFALALVALGTFEDLTQKTEPPT